MTAAVSTEKKQNPALLLVVSTLQNKHLKCWHRKKPLASGHSLEVQHRWIIQVLCFLDTGEWSPLSYGQCSD